jgi:hypothetical protein
MPKDQWQKRMQLEWEERRLTADVWREHGARNLTTAQRDVLIALRTYLPAENSPPLPTAPALAECVGCSISTAQRTLTVARRLGLLSGGKSQ